MASKAIGLLETRGLTALVTGVDAMLKSANVSLHGPMKQVGNALVSAVVMEGGQDPGDLLKVSQGAQRFQQLLQQALPEVEFRFQQAAQAHDPQHPEGKRRILETLTPRLLAADPLDRVAEALKAVVCSRLGLERRALED